MVNFSHDRGYDEVSREHMEECPGDPDCICAEIEQDAYDREMDRRVDRERDRYID